MRIDVLNFISEIHFSAGLRRKYPTHVDLFLLFSTVLFYTVDGRISFQKKLHNVT